MRTTVVIVLTTLFWLLGHGSAVAQKRIALLLGNKEYAPAVGVLKNPHNDVDLVGKSLETLGFKISVAKDADYASMLKAVKGFIQEVREAGPKAISFLYYSGHGVADPKTRINYLIPTDVKTADNSLWQNSVELKADIVDKLSTQAPDAIHYVVFDACRNELLLKADDKKALGSADKGFVPVATTTGLLLAYATGESKTASDMGDTAGPYARALAEELIKPGVEAVTMFRNVQLRVKDAIGQDPWLSFPTLSAVYLAGDADTRLDEKAFRTEREATRKNMKTLMDQVARAGIKPGGTIQRTQTWPVNQAIKVCFLDGDRELRSYVARVGREWTLYGEIDFDVGNWSDPRVCKEGDSGDLRISFQSAGNWAFVGTEAKLASVSGPTISLNSFASRKSSDFGTGKYDAEILHEFGHALGFEHSFQSPGSNCDAEFDWDAVYRLTEAWGWGRQKADVTLKSFHPSSNLFVGSFDNASIMNYSLPVEFFKKGKQSPCWTSDPTGLTLTDKLAVFSVYKASP